MRIFLTCWAVLVLLPWGNAENRGIQICLSKSLCLYLLQDDEMCSPSLACLLKNTTIEMKCAENVLKKISLPSLRLAPGNEVISQKTPPKYQDVFLSIQLSDSGDKYLVENFTIRNLENPELQAVMRKIFAHWMTDKTLLQLDKPIALMGQYRPFSSPSYTAVKGVPQFDVTQIREIDWERDEREGEIKILITWDIWNVSWDEKSKEMTIYSYPNEKFQMHITRDSTGRLALGNFTPVSESPREINQKALEYLKEQYSQKDFFDSKKILDSPLFHQIFPASWAYLSPDGRYCILQNTAPQRTIDFSRFADQDFAIFVQSGVLEMILQKIQPDPILSFLPVWQKIEPHEKEPNCLRLSIPREILGKPEKDSILTLDLLYSGEQEKKAFQKFCDTPGITCAFSQNRIFLGGEVLLFLQEKPLAKIKDIHCSAQIKYFPELKAILFIPEQYKEPEIEFFYHADKLAKNYKRIQLFCTTVWEIFSWALEKSNITILEQFWKNVVRYASRYERKIEVSNYEVMILDGHFVLYGNAKK